MRKALAVAAASPGMEKFTLSGSAGGHGAGGKVTVHHTGNITTNSAASHGIFAQSEGGSASFDSVLSELIASLDGLDPSDIAESDVFQFLFDKDSFVAQKTAELAAYFKAPGTLVGGDVEVMTDGNIVANGAASMGIYAQIKGGDGNGKITVDVKGLVQGGSGAGSAGIVIQDGASNILTIKTDSIMVTTLDGLSGRAILGGLGNETVNNSGTVTGVVDLGTGVNAFNTLAGGHLNAGATVSVGVGNTLTNNGMFSPGGVGLAMTTSHTGHLVQGASGEYVTDLDFSTAQVDRVNVSGTSSLDGKIAINLVNPGYASPAASSSRLSAVRAASTRILTFRPHSPR